MYKILEELIDYWIGCEIDEHGSFVRGDTRDALVSTAMLENDVINRESE